MKLYELTGKYLELMEFIEDSEEPVDFKDTIDVLEDDIKEKAENCSKMVKTLMAEAAAIKKEEERLEKLRKSRENNAKRLKEYLEIQLQQADLNKLKAGLFNLNIQNNPASVKITDETKIPNKYKISQPDKLDKQAMLEKLKNGESIEGAEIYQGKSLRIR